MALVKGINSYATVLEADTYFADRIDVAAWTGGSSDQKGQALVTATSEIDGMDWTGSVVSEAQLLAFPRVGSYYDPRLGYWIELPSSVPSRIIIATYELAYHLLNNDGLRDNTGGIKSLTVGPISLENIVTASKAPSVVMKTIKPLLANSGSKTWWRAN